MSNWCVVGKIINMKFLLSLVVLFGIVGCTTFRDGDGNIGYQNAPSGCYIIKEPNRPPVERCYNAS